MAKVYSDGRTKVHLSKTNTALFLGDVDLTTWDDEEILRGQKKASNGKWVGRPPAVVPHAIHEERIRRTMTKAHELLRESTYAAVALLQQVVEDENASYGFRLAAAQQILDRTLPKNQNYHVSVDAQPLFVRLLQGGAFTAIVPGELGPVPTEPIPYDDADVIDADVVEDVTVASWE